MIFHPDGQILSPTSQHDSYAHNLVPTLLKPEQCVERERRAVAMEETGAVATRAVTTNSNLFSPPRTTTARGKERRNPSITPRKFQRFFTPRSRVSEQPSAARKALHDLTAPALNRYQTPSSPLKPLSDVDGEQHARAGLAARGTKRRKVHHTPESSPLKPLSLHPTPVEPDEVDARPGLLSPIESFHASQEDHDGSDSDAEDSIATPDHGALSVGRPAQLPHRGYEEHLLQRMTGGMPGAVHQLMRCPVSGKTFARAHLESALANALQTGGWKRRISAASLKISICAQVWMEHPGAYLSVRLAVIVSS